MNSRFRQALGGWGMVAVLLVSAWISGCVTTPVDVGTPAPNSEPCAIVKVAAARNTPAVRGLRADLGELFADPDFANAFWGVRVERLNGRVLYDQNGCKEFVPASNMKLYTTAAALELLGPDFTYETRLEAVGTINAQGLLEGDLVIVGSGDPSFGSWHLKGGGDSRELLRSWAEQVKAAGITGIQGDIIGDGRCFTDEYYSDTWEYGDLPYWYATGSSGLAIEENCFRFRSAPGPNVGDKAILTLIPETDYITVVNDTVTTESGASTNLDIVWRNPESNTVRFARQIAIDKKPFEQRGSVWDGPRYTAFLFREALERGGTSVSGEALNILSLGDPGRIDNTAASRRRVIATYTSPPLKELIAIVNKPSHNFFADQILRTLGMKYRGRGSFAAGAEVIQDWLGTIGAPEPGALRMSDGSGLARRNIVQPGQTCALLRHMYQEESLRQVFYDSLPIAGVDGTIRGRMRGTAAEGNVHAKTGFITRARALSGYVTDAGGQILVFSMMANQFTVPVSEANAIQDQACEILAQFSEEVD